MIPHVKVPADSAFNTAYLMALDTLIAKASDPLDQQGLKSTRLLKIEEFGNYRVPEEKLKDYAGSYGTRIIIYQQGQLYLARNGRPGYKLFPVSDASFIADITGVRIDFILSPEGRATALDFTRPNGEITRSGKNQ